MRRREVIFVLATMFGTRAAFGQKAPSKRLIGVLMGATNDAEAEARGSVFEEALRILGWRCRLLGIVSVPLLRERWRRRRLWSRPARLVSSICIICR